MAGKGDHTEGRLRARPVGAYRTAPVGPPPAVPPSAATPAARADDLRTGEPRPADRVLHGAASRAEDVSALLEDFVERIGLILLAPNSREYTWDVIAGGYGPDVAAVDRALEWTFASHKVDPARVAIGGFSDGASYALSLGITNGDLFTHVLAFSPGFAAPARRRGRAPRSSSSPTVRATPCSP